MAFIQMLLALLLPVGTVRTMEDGTPIPPHT